MVGKHQRPRARRRPGRAARCLGILNVTRAGRFIFGSSEARHPRGAAASSVSPSSCPWSSVANSRARSSPGSRTCSCSVWSGWSSGTASSRSWAGPAPASSSCSERRCPCWSGRFRFLLFFSLVTFFTNEYWQLFGEASDVPSTPEPACSRSSRRSSRRPAPGKRPGPRTRQRTGRSAPPAAAGERRAGDLHRAGAPDRVRRPRDLAVLHGFGALLVTPEIREL